MGGCGEAITPVAITPTLIERFGSIAASWIVAGVFTPIGLGATRATTPKCL
jgi:hypothetical protein